VQQVTPDAGPRVVGVDVGGTFTDCVVVGSSGVSMVKLPSTPGDPSLAVVEGVRKLDPAEGAAVAHGTTVATNALLERDGARTVLVTTAGFEDVLALGRGEREDLYSLTPRTRRVLVPRELCVGVAERVGADGAVVTPLASDAPNEIARWALDVGAEAVAVCLLFSYLRPEHERALGVALEELLGATPGGGARSAASPDANNGKIRVSLSVDVLPETREYERASTTTVNAYVAPKMASYIGRLQAAVSPRSLTVMASHAGTLGPSEAVRLPVATVLSGPAAGVTGALAVASRAGRERVMTFDMGGTSTDVALCEGSVPFTSAVVIDGLPIGRPAVDVHTVGAGGGSIVRADEGGALRVGPESSGAVPGPASYNRGGTAPTVTDAHVLLGRLPSGVPLAGGLRLDREAASAAMSRVAEPLGLSLQQAALGALAVANATMERALRRVSVEQGHDPRSFTLVAFGGAGPLHACALADALGVPEVLVPLTPGALSALGLAIAPPVATASRSVPLQADEAIIEGLFGELERTVLGSLSSVAVTSIQREADLRYVGQSWELTVPWSSGTLAARRAFEETHLRRYGYVRSAEPVEVVTLRVRAQGLSRVGLPEQMPAVGRSLWEVRYSKVVLSDGTEVDAQVVPRDRLGPGDMVTGPAVVIQPDTTTFVDRGWRANAGEWGDMILTRIVS